MNLTFNTQNADASIALKALQQYRSAEFLQAIETLTDVLDMEPHNWQARLMLAVCYYKTTQYLPAERAFRLVYDQAPEADIRRKGLEGLLATKSKLERKTVECPPEFGTYVERNMPEPLFPWLEHIVRPQTAPARAWRPSYSR
jgi:hypothetical protein